MASRTFEIDQEKLDNIKRQLSSGKELIDVGRPGKLKATSPILKRMLTSPQSVDFLRVNQTLGLPTTPMPEFPTRSLGNTGGTQNINISPGTTPGQFDMALQNIMQSRAKKSTDQYISGGSAAMQGLMTLPEQLSSTEGWGGLNLSQARRLEQMEESGLSNMYEGFSGALEGKRSRLEDLRNTAVDVFKESLDQQAAEDAAKLKAEDVKYHKELDILNMRLDYPAGQSFTIEGKNYTGLKEKSASSASSGKTVSWDEKAGTSKTGPFENKITGQGVITAYGSSAWAPGLDVSGEVNSKILSPYDGTVVEITNEFKTVGPNNEEGLNQNSGFGNQVKIKMNDGNVMWISHLNAVDPNLEVGREITTGGSLGMMGNTGYTMGATGVHVDITVEKPDGGYLTPQQVEKYVAGVPGQGLESYKTSETPGLGVLSDVLSKTATGTGAQGVVKSIVDNTTVLKTLASGLGDVDEADRVAVIKQSVLDSRNVEISDAQAEAILKATEKYLG
jgi:murein DD-endopeptidase MepM/ murein hydrolase activator NlpD